ncbi:BnaA03g56590D [Brassica napus]|uniref:(rape) hypothetical protein n=1 Tax=Brassica napus TaxID=3708 RepID=A0A078J4B3_BRANA|nr:unnamed protein product [Brassica napus]CDY60995.1 BnaA03g56590D [Brassica napus]
MQRDAIRQLYHCKEASLWVAFWDHIYHMVLMFMYLIAYVMCTLGPLNIFVRS